MVSVTGATEIILAQGYKPSVVKVELKHAVGRVLAETILADRDFPPFNRVAMDGIAIKFEAWKAGVRKFRIEAMQPAGAPQKELVDPTACIEVMTGAILPSGTDTVVRYEDIDIKENAAMLLIDGIREQQNVHPQAQDAKKDSVLVQPSSILSPAEVALLASVGKHEVGVYAFPTIAIVATGDELVDVEETPMPHQIRKSNSYALEAAIQQMGGESHSFHIIDAKEILGAQLQVILQRHDVVILSGGISKGKFDLIPGALESLGVKKLFHQVSQRPGKPFWFGVSEQGHKVVFALPGNPVSTYLCFYRYIKPWLLKNMGLKNKACTAVLAQDFTFQQSLTYFMQVKIECENGILMAYPAAGGGSGDFANLKNVDGFLELPLDGSEFKKGEVFPFIPFR